MVCTLSEKPESYAPSTESLRDSQAYEQLNRARIRPRLTTTPACRAQSRAIARRAEKEYLMVNKTGRRLRKVGVGAVAAAAARGRFRRALHERRPGGAGARRLELEVGLALRQGGPVCDDGLRPLQAVHVVPAGRERQVRHAAVVVLREPRPGDHLVRPGQQGRADRAVQVGEPRVPGEAEFRDRTFIKAKSGRGKPTLLYEPFGSVAKNTRSAATWRSA